MEYNLKLIYESPDDYKDFLYISGQLIYRIRNSINNKSYIGLTKVNLRYRLFDAWHGGHFYNYENGIKSPLYNSMRKYGLDKFFISILSTNLEDSEDKFIELYDSFFNGYNGSISGLPFNEGSGVEGKLIVNNGNKEERIKPSEIDNYISKGYSVGRLKSLFNRQLPVYKGEELLYITHDEFSHYLELGYSYGNPKISKSLKGGSAITNTSTNEVKVIDRSDRLKYGSDWIDYRGVSTCSGYKFINNGVDTKFVHPDELEKYLKNGWKLGKSYSSGTKGKVPVNLSGVIIYVSRSDLPNYIDKGWSIGTGLTNSNMLGKICVNDGKSNKFIDKGDLELFLSKGWVKSKISEL